jgi:putative DNA primase/helicase
MSEPAPVIDLAEARDAEEKRGVLKGIDAQLQKNKDGLVLGTISNLILIIGQDPVLAGLCGFDDFECAAVLHSSPPPVLDGTEPIPGPYPRPWIGSDVSHILSYIQRVWTRLAKIGEVEHAMGAVAAVRRFHPVRDWLATLAWDGVPRVDTWLVHAFGAVETSYTAAVGSKILIAALRRVRRPGCKFDHMMILEGPQGIGKSKAISALFSEIWTTDSLLAELNSRDGALGLLGIWLIEFAEIEQIIRTEVEVIKGFLSRSVDRYRSPYGRGFLKHPRQCVFIGTTNDDDYLRDSTGNRRFWPIRCQFADVEWVMANRDQLWAEAAAREAAGEDHWLSDPETNTTATKVQAARVQEDVWADRVLNMLGLRTAITIPEVLSDILAIPVERQGKREQMRVAAILRTAGWKRETKWDGGKAAKRWLVREPGGGKE